MGIVKRREEEKIAKNPLPLQNHFRITFSAFYFGEQFSDRGLNKRQKQTSVISVYHKPGKFYGQNIKTSESSPRKEMYETFADMLLEREGPRRIRTRTGQLKKKKGFIEYLHVPAYKCILSYPINTSGINISTPATKTFISVKINRFFSWL